MTGPVELDVLVIGGVGIDTIVRVPSLPLADADSIAVDPIESYLGHTGHGVALGCHLLGLNAGLVDVIGDDPEGARIRRTYQELGLPRHVLWRQPFPGPGLAVRIVGEVTAERVEVLQRADAVVTEEVKRAGLYRKLWQSFAVLPAVRSVGVMGDERTYAYPIVIRAVTSDDAMTADWARLPYDLLERISSRLINEVPGVNRVAYDITSKPPGTIEWE